MNKYQPTALTGMTAETIAQPGTYLQLFFVPVEDVASIGDYDADGNIPSVTLHAGKAWLQIATPPIDRQLQTEMRSGDGGAYAFTTVTGRLPFENAANKAQLEAMPHHRYILRVLTPNDIWRLVGTIEAPCRFATVHATGPGTNSPTGSTFTFSCTSEEAPAIFTEGEG